MFWSLLSLFDESQAERSIEWIKIVWANERVAAVEEQSREQQ